MSFTDRLKLWLDRPGIRFLLVPLISQLARSQGKGVQRIFYDDGVWMHETSSGYFAYHQPYIRLDLSTFDKLTRVNFRWGYTPKPGDVVVDVGAGVGEEALSFSRAVGQQGRVICIEAHPRTYRCLTKLVEYNRLQNVTAISLAIAPVSDGIVHIEDSREYLRNRVSDGGGIAVRGSTIDDICRNLGLSHIDFLKMNIEGSELHAVRGMTETLRHTEVLCICCHDFLADETGNDALRTKSPVREFLEEQGITVVERKAEGLPRYVSDQLWGFNQEVMSRAG